MFIDPESVVTFEEAVRLAAADYGPRLMVGTDAPIRLPQRQVREWQSAAHPVVWPLEVRALSGQRRPGTWCQIGANTGVAPTAEGAPIELVRPALGDLGELLGGTGGVRWFVPPDYEITNRVSPPFEVAAGWAAVMFGDRAGVEPTIARVLSQVFGGVDVQEAWCAFHSRACPMRCDQPEDLNAVVTSIAELDGLFLPWSAYVVAHASDGSRWGAQRNDGFWAVFSDSMEFGAHFARDVLDRAEEGLLYGHVDWFPDLGRTVGSVWPSPSMWDRKYLFPMSSMRLYAAEVALDGFWYQRLLVGQLERLGETTSVDVEITRSSDAESVGIRIGSSDQWIGSDDFRAPAIADARRVLGDAIPRTDEQKKERYRFARERRH